MKLDHGATVVLAKAPPKTLSGGGADDDVDDEDDHRPDEQPHPRERRGARRAVSAELEVTREALRAPWAVRPVGADAASSAVATRELTLPARSIFYVELAAQLLA